jgi:hypothetical protein
MDRGTRIATSSVHCRAGCSGHTAALSRAKEGGVDRYDAERLVAAKEQFSATLTQLRRAREGGDYPAVERLHGALVTAAWEVGHCAFERRLSPKMRAPIEDTGGE